MGMGVLETGVPIAIGEPNSTLEMLGFMQVSQAGVQQSPGESGV